MFQGQNDNAIHLCEYVKSLLPLYPPRLVGPQETVPLGLGTLVLYDGREQSSPFAASCGGCDDFLYFAIHVCDLPTSLEDACHTRLLPV